MPISKENKKRYPSDWYHIALKVKTQACWNCQQCGKPCKHPDESWMNFEKRVLRNRPDVPQPIVRGQHILTVAHLNHTPEDCSPANLKAMCSVCHLRYDKQHHIESRKLNRQKGVK